MEMDFKYIEQLIGRYFNADTTLEEEQILRQFFQQTEIPAHLQQWAPLFKAERTWSNTHLDDSFDERILRMTGEVHVQARRITLTQRLRPLLRVAALLVIAAGVGIAVQHGSDETTRENAVSTVGLQASETQDELDLSNTTPLDLQADAGISLADTLAPGSTTTH